MESTITHRSCLIIKNDGIGDLILASGLIAAVGKLFDGNVDLVTCSANQEIAEGIEPLRNRFYVSRDGIHFSSLAARFGILYPRVPLEDKLVLSNLASHRYEIVICLRRFMRQSTLVMMCQIRGEKKFCAWEFPTNATRQMAERCTNGWIHYSSVTNALSELKYNKEFLENILNTPLDYKPHLSFCQSQTILPKTRRVCLGLGGDSKNWPYGNWVELAMQLAAQGWSIVLLGGDNVSVLAVQIKMKVPDAENLVGQMSWRNTAELLSDCEGYIGNDTGLSHFASLIVKKCVIILGGRTFRRFFPWPDPEVQQYVIFHGLECFDCGDNCRYQDRFCLSLIRPCNVMDYFSEVINGQAKPECDLNINNEAYTTLWCRENKHDMTLVRPYLPNSP